MITINIDITPVTTDAWPRFFAVFAAILAASSFAVFAAYQQASCLENGKQREVYVSLTNLFYYFSRREL